MFTIIVIALKIFCETGPRHVVEYQAEHQNQPLWSLKFDPTEE